MSQVQQAPQPPHQPEPTAAPSVAEVARQPVVYVRESDEVIDLRFLFASLWRGWWVILLFMLVGLYFGYRNVQGFVPKYVASMIVSPSTGKGAGELSAQMGRVSQIAGLDISLGGREEPTTFDRLEVILGSIELAEVLQRKYGYLQKLFSGSWNAEEQRWIRPSGDRFEWRQQVNAFLKQRLWRAPDIESLAGYVGGSVQILPIEGSPFKKIEFQHVDSGVALEVLRTVYAEADELVREQDKAETLQRKAYLQQQLSQTSVGEMRAPLIGLLTSEERTAMLLEGDLPYSARIIVPPHVSAEPTSPNLLSEIGVPLAVSFAIGATAVMMIALYRRE